MQPTPYDLRFNLLLGQLSAVESAVIFLMQREFSRERDPRLAATGWFDGAIATAGRTDHALRMPTDAEQQGAQAVLTELHRELVRMKSHVLASLGAPSNDAAE